jgi:hypothetical protein
VDGQGLAQINVSPFPDFTRTTYPIGPGFALHPVFSADGSRLFYFSGNGLWTVPVEYAPLRFSHGTPELLFEGTYWYGFTGPGGLGARAWDVHPDGDRFFMIRLPEAAPGRPQIVFIQNWLEELISRVRVP